MSEEAGSIDTNQEVEQQARRMGWVPEDEFRGDPDKWIDAESFSKRASQELPIARGTIRTLDRKVGTLEQRIKEMSETFGQFNEYHKLTAQREYERALKSLKKEMRAAADEGDVAKFDAVEGEINSLIESQEKVALKTTEKADAPPGTPGDPQVYEDWKQENTWYEEEPDMGIYAMQTANYLAAAKPNLTQKQQLEEIAKLVKKKFPDFFGNPKRSTASAVTSGDRYAAPGAGSKGKKGYNDLPPEDKVWCDKFCREIPGFTRDEYMGDYQWDK